MAPNQSKRKANQVSLGNDAPRPPPAARASRRSGATRASNPPPVPYEQTTDRSLIDRPVGSRILEGMSEAWAISEDFQMCILFDTSNPVRQFKRGTVFDQDDDDPFPDYNPDDSDFTESDEEGSLQPYKPAEYRHVHLIAMSHLASLIHMVVLSSRYRFKCTITLSSFMKWTSGQLHGIEFGKTRKVPKKKRWIWTMKLRRIPVPYARVVHQFLLEIEHGKADMGHESLRHRTYAEKMLDMFGEELSSYHGSEADFRSKVLTPVLQRQLRGVPDTYAPAIRHAITQNPKKQPTISQVTSFYLGNDPLDPQCIPSYRRNMVYIREMMWHLGILLGQVNVKDVSEFNRYICNNDLIVESLQGTRLLAPRGIPKLNEMEVAAIYVNGMEGFFAKELDKVVLIFSPSLPQPSNQHPI